ncbi:hypothetical protein SLEP1_g22773 [Rubroshorea leprosula]|uniref:Uncharacterized protein n=1 Tax=Rubroshorea leprosula TaxID=152421 RepID=A0AAV5JL53_9ROSI|nr:hypothetical protein SLEP1_g22773 [Rubroshorea leprosula]
MFNVEVGIKSCVRKKGLPYLATALEESIPSEDEIDVDEPAMSISKKAISSRKIMSKDKSSSVPAKLSDINDMCGEAKKVMIENAFINLCVAMRRMELELLELAKANLGKVRFNMARSGMSGNWDEQIDKQANHVLQPPVLMHFIKVAKVLTKYFFLLLHFLSPLPFLFSYLCKPKPWVFSNNREANEIVVINNNEYNAGALDTSANPGQSFCYYCCRPFSSPVKPRYGFFSNPDSPVNCLVGRAGFGWSFNCWSSASCSSASSAQALGLPHGDETVTTIVNSL